MPKPIIAVLAALTVALALAVAIPEQADAFSSSANERALVKLINHARSQRGLKTLDAASALCRAARAHSRDMLARDYFGHSSLCGTSFDTRARRAGYSRSGCSSWAVGEVLAWGRGLRGTPQAAFALWMRSPAHRRSILNRRWRDIGVGCRQGTFRGVSGAIMYTVDFGRRLR